MSKEQGRIEVYFRSGRLHDTINNPKDAGVQDGCYYIDTYDNKCYVYPLTSIEKVIESDLNVKKEIKPEDLEYGQA